MSARATARYAWLAMHLSVFGGFFILLHETRRCFVTKYVHVAMSILP